MLISLNSAIGEGKDTVADLIQKHSPIRFANKKFAEKLKQMVAVLTGCSREDLEDQDFKNQIAKGGFTHPITKEPVTYRWILQYMGTELFRDRFDPDTWVKSTFAGYQPEKFNWLITDMRFPNELEYVQKQGGTAVLIMRYKSLKEWTEEFKPFLKVGSHLIQYPTNTEKIAKQEVIDWIIENNLYDDFHPEFLKVSHSGERGLWLKHKSSEITFDAIIKNDGTLKELEEKVIKFVDEFVVEGY